MANESVSIRGRSQDIYLGDGGVLSILIDGNSKDYPPTAAAVVSIGSTIQGLARAAKSVAWHVRQDGDEPELKTQAIEDIADAIVTLSMLQTACVEVLNRNGAQS